MPLNLHLLRLFSAVAAHRSFSRAAEALHISQPAVSRGVREFEAQLGSPLLERGVGGVRLTEAGAELLAHAQTIFATERTAEEGLAARRGLHRGSLSVGASTTIATYLLGPILGAYHQAYPEIDLRLTSANTHDVAERLARRELDIALVEGPVDGVELVVQPWRRDEMIVIAGPRHRLAAATRPLKAARLNDEIMLMREPGSGSREVVAAALAAHRIRPRKTIEIGSTEAIKQFVAAGLGLAVVSAATASDQITLGKLKAIRFSDFTVSRMLTRLNLPGRQPSAAAAAFEKFLAPGASSQRSRDRAKRGRVRTD